MLTVTVILSITVTVLLKKEQFQRIGICFHGVGKVMKRKTKERKKVENSKRRIEKVLVRDKY